MANIKIDNEYRVVSDRYNWTLQLLSDKGAWRPVSYHSSVRKAAIAYIETSLRLSSAESIKELLAVLKKCEEKIDKLFENI